ncbi:predicted protein [Naegleria gruberi]|uniref:Predicted protein n=1 Tax=Naegleria gruberi TaxID=5762 RepID=D2VUY5_NAEGR|nr:uncharacterized protein NAEGRDRAFT_52460 [Naegleria gruberi]EFC39400.1 predicted protein [Naegleria gruberi]|eukprot:XP_002672144.1 predicted protein [Naegleria gruberi strain NEG-M]
MTNQFNFVGNRIVSSSPVLTVPNSNLMVESIFESNTNQNSVIQQSSCCIQTSFLPLCIEPTFLQLDMDDFVNTLEQEYYTHMPIQASVASTLKVPSPTTPLFKCKWMKTLSNRSSSQPVPQIDFRSISTITQHDDNRLSTSPSSESSSPNPNTHNIKSNSSNLKSQCKTTISKTKIQKKRNYQRVFHTIPPRNTCSEKKSGSWKFHLMDAEEDEEYPSNYKFHIYTGRNNSNTSNDSSNSNNSKQ